LTNRYYDEDTLDFKSRALTPIASTDVNFSSVQKFYQKNETTLSSSSPSSSSLVETYSSEIPEHLQLALTLSTMQNLLNQLPQDAIKACNDQIPINGNGMPTFPLNDHVNGYVNQHCIINWARVDDLSVCQRLMNDPIIKAVGVGKAKDSTFF